MKKDSMLQNPVSGIAADTPDCAHCRNGCQEGDPMRETSFGEETGSPRWFRHSLIATLVFGFLAVCILPFLVLPAGAAVPNSSFTADPTHSAIYPMTVQFTDTSTGSPTAWNWTFDDTYTSTEQNPVHVYTVATADDYHVLFNASNAEGVGETVFEHVHLTSDVDSNLISWLHFNSSATRGELGNAWAASGATFATTPYKFNGGSLAIQTNKAYLYSGSSPVWNIGSGAAEIEFWIYVTLTQSGGAGGRNIVSRSSPGGTSTTSGWGFYNGNSDTSYRFWMGSLSNATSQFTIPRNEWHHIVIAIPASGTINIYKDGVIAATGTRPPGSYDTPNPIVIGSANPGILVTYYMNEFRMSTGTERFTMDHFSPPYDMYRGNLTDTFVDINENATLLYKPWPGTAPSAAYNGTWANRTAQIMNVTNVASITTSVIYPPIYEFAANPFPNTTGLAKYPDLQVTGISIDSTNGLVTFTVSRSGGGGISSLFDNRTSLVDIPFMYYNYSTDQYWETYFANAHMTDGINHMTYPIHNFLNTTRPVGTWTIYSDFTANRLTAVVGEPIAFTDLSRGEPTGWTIWNWSFGDGSWTNGTTKNPGHTYAAPGTYTVSMTSWLLANESITNTTTRTDYITVTSAPPDLSISINQSSIYLPLATGSTATNGSLALNVSAGGPFTIKVEGNTGRIESQGHMGSYTNGAYDAAGPALASPLELAGTSNGTITAQTVTPPILPSGSTLYTYTESAPVVNQILAPNTFSQPVVMSDPSLSSGSTYRIDLVFVITSA